MKGYMNIVWILVLMLVVGSCQSRKHRDKTREPRDKRHRSRGKHEDPDIPVSVCMNDVMHEICLPSETDRLVYRYKNDSHIFIGFDVVKDNTVHSMSWEIDAERLTHQNHNKFQLLPADEVRNFVKTNHLLAATNRGQQDRFLENLSSCSQSRIVSKACVIQSFAALARKMEDVTFGKPCGKSDPQS